MGIFVGRDSYPVPPDNLCDRYPYRQESDKREKEMDLMFDI